MIKKVLLAITNYHRRIIWIALGILFILDIITTTIGLQKGGFEQTPFMIPFVNNPILHLTIKLLAYCIICIPIQLFLKYLNKKIIEETGKINKICYTITYSIIILVLVWFIMLFLSINVNNIEFIISRN